MLVLTASAPITVEYTVICIPTPLEIKLHHAILTSSSGREVQSGGNSALQLSMMTLLRKLCNSPGLLLRSHKEGKSQEVLSDKILASFTPGQDPNSFTMSGKLRVLGALLERLHSGKSQTQARGDSGDGDDADEPQKREKIVVVSNFTSTLDIIEVYCRKKSFVYCRLDGQTPQKERMPIVLNFNKGGDAQSCEWP